MYDFLVDIEKEFASVTEALNDPSLGSDPKKLADLGRKKTELDTIMVPVNRPMQLKKRASKQSSRNSSFLKILMTAKILLSSSELELVAMSQVCLQLNSTVCTPTMPKLWAGVWNF